MAIPTYISDLDSGYQWNSSVVSYTFTSRSGYFGTSDGTDYRLMTSPQQAAIVDALEEFSNVANITFVDAGTQTPEKGITFRTADLPDEWAGKATQPSEQKSDVVLDHAYLNYLAPGRMAFHMMVHEIGHALGLEHPGDSGLNPNYTVDGTVMSYNTGATAGRWGSVSPESWANVAPQGLQIYDIATLQYKYGANHSYHAGNDIYNLTGETKIFTLWDGAGVDTVASDSYKGNVVIDLREGLEHITSVGGTKMWIAFGANMEIAKAGSGHDTLYGNDAANQLYGGGGNDSAYGGSGHDVIYGNEGSDLLSGEAGNDTITGGQENDVLQGGAGKDSLSGNTGDDMLYGDDDEDSLQGNDGNDTLNGGNGNDALNGGKDQDLLYGDGGNDLLSGDTGKDQLFGNEGNDTLQGGAEADMLMGGAGADRLSGGTGGDMFVFSSLMESTDTHYDVITDFARGQDRIYVTDLGFTSIAKGAGSGSQLGYSHTGNATVIVDADSTFSLTLTGKVALSNADILF